MKIGLVGYQGSGKSTLFHWLTGIAPDAAMAHQSQAAMAEVPDQRVDQLCDIYHPKKITQAALEILDTPGLARDHAGNAARLAMAREAGCLVMVVPAFDGADPLADLASFDEDLLLTDLELVSGRIERVREALKKPRPNRAEQEAELAVLEPVLETLEAGRAVREVELAPDQKRIIRSFQLMTEKRRLVFFNLADDADDPAPLLARVGEGAPAVAVRLGLELELAKMNKADRDEFRQEMGIEPFDRDALLRTLMQASGQMLFFTASEKEVRTWIIRQGGTAWEAADGIHSDLSRGFIRAEVMSCADLVRLGSERELKAAGLARQEPKDYVIQDGDILNIRFSV